MKVSSTKKLLIIFLSLICVFAMGVAGVLLGASSYGQASDKASPTSEISDDTFLNEEGNSATNRADNLQSPDGADEYAASDNFVSSFPEGVEGNPYTNFTAFRTLDYRWANAFCNFKVFNHAGTNVTSTTSWELFDDGVWYAEQRTGWGKMGQRTTITLAPGETFKIQLDHIWHTDSGVGISVQYPENCEPSDHWAYKNFQDTSHWVTGTWVIDGDAPTNTVFRVYNIMVGNGTNGWGHGFQTTDWSSSYPSYYGAYYTTTQTPGVGFCTIWTYEITVVRTAPEKPHLIDDGNGFNVSYDYSSATYAGTKIMTYTGEPATITFTPDFGSGVMDWSASPANMQVQSRSNHSQEIYNNGANNGTPANLVLETTRAGTYEITLRPVGGRWSDGSTGNVRFRLVVYELKTTKPKLMDDSGNLTNRTTKELNANEDGTPVTISFGNVDSRYVNCSTGGLNIASWTAYDDDTNTPNVLTLSGAYIGTYTITLSLKNSNACKWDDNSTGSCTFTFTIKDIKIDIPSILRETEAGRTDIKYTTTGTGANAIVTGISI